MPPLKQTGGGSKKPPAQAVRAEKVEAKITPKVADTKVKAAQTVAQVNALRDTRKQDDLQNKAIQQIKNGQIKYVPPTVYIPPKDEGGKDNKGNNGGTVAGPEPGPPQPAVPTPPVKGGIAQSRNIRTGYLKLIETLTSNLLKNADSLLFAYNFKSIERMVSYTLEQDDQNQRQSQIVSNIKRSFSGVPLTELQIRDRLNAVVNQISQEIGDLTPASTKLAKFGMKKDNRDFQGGTPRIQNSRAVYDLELKLPSLEGFNYSVTYRIKCFDID
jgi:hypothetical protein